MSIAWVSADLRTGNIVADLPSFWADYPLRRTISNYDTATGHLHLAGAPENWMRATLPGACVLACYDDDDPAASIIWAGLGLVRTRTVTSDVVDLSLLTFEGYLDRRFVPDKTYAIGAYQVAQDLIANYVADQPGEPGILRVTTTRSTNGPTVDYTTASSAWQNTDNASVLARLTSMIGQYGGEFTTEWAWTNSGQALAPTLLIGDRIGQAAPAGLDPAVTFEMPGSLLDAQVVEDYSAGKGANKLVYYSSGQGSFTPYAPAVYAPDLNGRPVFEFREQPAPSLDVPALTQYARQAVAILAPGAQAVTLTASIRDAGVTSRRVGVDWHLGDDIGYVIQPVDDQGQPIPAFYPDGSSGVGRVIAYEIDSDDQNTHQPTKITPILADKKIYGGP